MNNPKLRPTRRSLRILLESMRKVAIGDAESRFAEFSRKTVFKMGGRKRPAGRPSKYCSAIARKICAAVRKGVPIRDLSKAVGVHHKTVKRWECGHHDFLIMLQEAKKTAAYKKIGKGGRRAWRKFKEGEE